jgi:hypothetical protein
MAQKCQSQTLVQTHRRCPPAWQPDRQRYRLWTYQPGGIGTIESADGTTLGLGRVVALYYCSSAVYANRLHIRCLCF